MAFLGGSIVGGTCVYLFNKFKPSKLLLKRKGDATAQLRYKDAAINLLSGAVNYSQVLYNSGEYTLCYGMLRGAFQRLLMDDMRVINLISEDILLEADEVVLVSPNIAASMLIKYALQIDNRLMKEVLGGSGTS